ncbi:MAG: methyltransferase domain-containing protein [Myxococcota bacterium]
MSSRPKARSAKKPAKKAAPASERLEHVILSEQVTLEIDMPIDLADQGYQPKSTADAKPLWGFLWPSATAMGRLIVQGEKLRGKRIIDLGCGLGVVGMAAAAMGATVVSADIRPEAIRLVEKNAARNGLKVQGLVLDFHEPPPDLGLFDGILGADILYDDGMLRGVLRFIRRHLAPDGLGVLADPMRVLPGGVAGAARLSGLEVTSTVLRPGTVVSGGITLYELWRRPIA